MVQHHFSLHKAILLLYSLAASDEASGSKEEMAMQESMPFPAEVVNLQPDEEKTSHDEPKLKVADEFAGQPATEPEPEGRKEVQL